jgi:acetyltransferase-like isoleucine patch superfamily enzyme
VNTALAASVLFSGAGNTADGAEMLTWMARLFKGGPHGWGQLGTAGAAAVRGCWYVLFFRIFRADVSIGLPFFAYESVRVTGPGRVRIGKGCSVFPNVFRGLTIATLSPDATVDIGDRCELGGLTIRCRNQVALGAGVRTARCVVQDVAFFGSDAASSRLNGSRARVLIGDNVWLGALSRIGGGATVGRDSVLSWGAVCIGTDVPDSTLAVGNPTARSIPIARVVTLTEAGR